MSPVHAPLRGSRGVCGPELDMVEPLHFELVAARVVADRLLHLFANVLRHALAAHDMLTSMTASPHALSRCCRGCVRWCRKPSTRGLGHWADAPQVPRQRATTKLLQKCCGAHVSSIKDHNLQPANARCLARAVSPARDGVWNRMGLPVSRIDAVPTAPLEFGPAISRPCAFAASNFLPQRSAASCRSCLRRCREQVCTPSFLLQATLSSVAGSARVTSSQDSTLQNACRPAACHDGQARQVGERLPKP